MFTAKIKEKSTGKMKSMRLLAVLLVPMVALIMGATTPEVWAFGNFWEECEGDLELDESEVFFEFNFTDCDLGIQFFWDGSPWRSMIVRDESGRSVLNVFPRGSVRGPGLAEGFFEGAEPQLVDPPTNCALNHQNVQAFLQQYMEGEYTFRGVAAEERCLLLGDAVLTYNFPDAVDLNVDEFPEISWMPGGGAPVVGYEIVIEVVFRVPENGDFDEQVFKETATFPGTVTSYTVSTEFEELINEHPASWEIEELKVEILAQEESGNKIITEAEVED